MEHRLQPVRSHRSVLTGLVLNPVKPVLRPSKLRNISLTFTNPFVRRSLREYLEEMNNIGVHDLHKIIELKTTGAGDILLKKKR